MAIDADSSQVRPVTAFRVTIMTLNPNGDCATPDELWSDARERQQMEQLIDG